MKALDRMTVNPKMCLGQPSIWGMRITTSAILKMLPSFFPFVLCAALIGLRNPVALYRAEFWAEDATEFFFGSLSLGFKSLFVPVYGYHHLVSRLIAWGATFFPVLWTPHIYSWVSFLVNVWVASYFSREGFSWIIPSRNFRIFVCCVLALAPGTPEVYFNLCNLMSVLTFSGLLLLLEKPFPPGPVKCLAFVVLLFSAGPMFLLAPLVVFLGYRTRARRYWALLLCFVPVITINAIGNHYEAGSARLLNYQNVWLFPRILIDNALLRLFFVPFLGGRLTALAMVRDWIFWPASVAGLGVVAYFSLKRDAIRRESLLVLLLSFLCMVSAYGVVAVVRSSYAMGQVLRESGSPAWGLRYSYLPGVAALIFWFSLLFDLRAKRLGRLALFLLAVHCFAYWGSGYRRPDLHWPQGAEKIQVVLEQKKSGSLSGPVVIDDIGWVHPSGWRPNRGLLKLTIFPIDR